MTTPLVGIIMGSSSDHEVMSAETETLATFGVASETRVISAHRTPEDMVAYAKEAQGRGLKVIIAGAGGAAHLPGMVAALTTLPVIGVPVAQPRLDGLDALLSIVQMPRGVPVATVAINNATNAALLALRILGTHDAGIASALAQYADDIALQARAQDAQVVERTTQA